MRMTEELLREIAEEYCLSHISLGELAKKHGFSKTTLVRYFGENCSIKLSPILQQLVDERKRENWIEGKSTSGNLGNKKFSEEQIVSFATYMIENNLTLNDLSSTLDVSASGLYGMFNKDVLGEELYKELQDHYAGNKQNAPRRR